MNYYKRHLGDYAAATGHLSLVEHGAYNKMLDRYYSSEQPLPADPAALYRLIGARDKIEREATDVVAAEFFVRDGEVLRHKRVDEEIADASERAEHNRSVGKKGGRPAKFKAAVPQGTKPNGFPNETQPVSENNPMGFENETDRVSKNNPSHKPLANSQEKEKSKGAEAPWLLPDWIDAAAWSGFEEMRKKIRKPMTDRARSLVVNELARLRDAGIPPIEVLDQSTRNCWQDVYAPKPNGAASGSKPGGMIPAGPKDYHAGVSRDGSF